MALFLCLTVPGLSLASVSDCCRDLSLAMASPLPEAAQVHDSHQHGPGHLPSSPASQATDRADSAPPSHDQAEAPLGQNCGLLPCLKIPTATVAAVLSPTDANPNHRVIFPAPSGFVLKQLPKSIFRPPRQLLL